MPYENEQVFENIKSQLERLEQGQTKMQERMSELSQAIESKLGEVHGMVAEKFSEHLTLIERIHALVTGAPAGGAPVPGSVGTGSGKTAPAPTSADAGTGAARELKSFCKESVATLEALEENPEVKSAAPAIAALKKQMQEFLGEKDEVLAAKGTAYLQGRLHYLTGGFNGLMRRFKPKEPKAAVPKSEAASA